LTKEKADKKKKRKQKPFLDTKENHVETIHKKKNTVCVCNSEMCDTHTHSPETKKEQTKKRL
jgi:hypothetical protein